jgi:hypothetical protein
VAVMEPPGRSSLRCSRRFPGRRERGVGGKFPILTARAANLEHVPGELFKLDACRPPCAQEFGSATNLARRRLCGCKCCR